jgi:hypothetical protein
MPREVSAELAARAAVCLVAVGLVVAAVVVVGCGAGSGEGAGTDAGNSASNGEDTASDTKSETTGPEICTQEVREDVEDTVRGQTQAISARDYERALEFSSNRYRSGTNPEQFGALIEDSYDYLLTTSDYDFADCYVYDDPELEVVTITAQYGDVALAYYLIEEDGAWRIELAGAPTVASQPEPAV